MTPAEQLRELESNLHRLPVPLARWLAAGLRRYQSTGDMGAALGLNRPGAIRTRNRALLRAAHLVAPNERPWTQAGALKQAIDNFESVSKKREYLTGWRLEVWRALNAGVSVPRSQKRLHELLTQSEKNVRIASYSDGGKQ